MKEYNIKQNGNVILAVAPTGIVYAEHGGSVYAGDPVTAVIGGGLGLAGSLIGASKASSASKSAANAQRDATAYQTDMQKEMYDLTRGDFAPYRDMGLAAIPYLQNSALNPQGITESRGIANSLYGMNNQFSPQNLPSTNINTSLPGANINTSLPQTLVDLNLPDTGINVDFDALERDPIYQHKLQAAQEAAKRSLAGSGLQNSRYGVNALSDVSLNTAANEIDNLYNRAVGDYNRKYNSAMSQYGADTEQYNRDLQNKLYQYGFDSDNYNRGYQNSMAQYGFDTDAYNRQNSRSLMNYDVDQQNYARAYNQGQNYLNTVNQLGNQQYGRLTDLVGIGQASAGQQAATNQNYANALTGISQANANALGGIYQNQGQQDANTWANLGALPMTMYNNYQYNNALNNLGSGGYSGQYSPGYGWMTP